MALRLVSAFTKYEERITSRGLNMYALSCARVGWRKSDEMSRRKIPRAFSGSGNAFGKSGPRILAKARVTNTLTRDRPIARSHHHPTNAVHPTASPHVVFICTARGLLRMFAAMRAPYSVKA